ncbi:hypothetical protein G5B31_01385 [Rhodobacter sp. SGA-6-6]|uniref:hypothetical protein n=1 Tax=Rhodobacter sp. SGA-6-6 TaxID=2710882 RepID=UPI0013EC7541|nr:hypothetical protein [Rhodobacter sp. SGA-6-6]NGM44182.1 hypothetical protein [Rhodobacter sp. SGA-6-6]
MKTIEIDFDVHRLIELERQGFDEPENSALRRLLKLPTSNAPSTPTKAAAGSEGPEETTDAGMAWSWKGVVLPHGTQLRMEYRGQMVRGQVQNGKWVVAGKPYTSPSDAAGSSVKTKRGDRPSLNGWVYWEVKRPTDTSWRKLNSLK